jgi:hypothetical protein
MNEISKVRDFTVGLFDAMDLVNTVTTVKTNDMDLNKENIYPIVNIDTTDVDVQTDAVLVSYTISILQQRDIANKKTDSKLLIDTNLIDNVNETQTIAAKFINYLRWQNNALNIEIQSIGSLDSKQNFKGSGLDGFQFDVELSIFNSGTSA